MLAVNKWMVNVQGSGVGILISARCEGEKGRFQWRYTVFAVLIGGTISAGGLVDRAHETVGDAKGMR